MQPIQDDTAPSRVSATPSLAAAQQDDPTPSSSSPSITEHDVAHQKSSEMLEKEVQVEAAHTGGSPAVHIQEEERPQRSKVKIALIMFSLAVAVLLVALDITIVTTALPTISEEFRSASGYTWVGSAYLIAQSAATPIWGKVSDIFGRKPILLVTNAIFFIGSLIAGLSINIDMLIAARAIQGIGGGGLITLVNIAISDLFAMRDRGAYFAVIGGVW